MGSVKDLIRDDSKAGRLYAAPTANEFGKGAWRVSGRFSVGDLKEQIPDTNIKDKAEALTMMTARFFEWLSENHVEIPTCYVGVLDKDGNVTDTQKLIDKGDKSNIIVMDLAHVPKTYCNGDLEEYRKALMSGELQCGVADVESIFRKGFPLGSSTFEKIFKAVDKGKEYETLATYDETVAGLDKIREMTSKEELSRVQKLIRVLGSSGLTGIPNPGYVLEDIVYNSTTKFEEAGDRAITKEEERKYSGLDEQGYKLWEKYMFPSFARAQIDFCDKRGILNIDGKGECVAYKRKPVITDFACTVDENRLMIKTKVDGVEWAIPSNKEIQRAIFRKEGVYAAISEAKERAEKEGDVNKWKIYIPEVLGERKIDIKAVAEHSCNLMEYAIGEVANRILEKRVFDAKPVDSWVREFVPYASKIQFQE